MGRLTNDERKALDELFTAMHEKRNFLQKVRNSRKEMIRLFKYITRTQKIQHKHF